MRYNGIFSICMAVTVLSACSDFTETTPKGKVIPTTTDDFKGMVVDVTNSSAAYPLANICSDDVFSATQNGNTTTGKAYYWMEDFYKANEGDNAWNDVYSMIYKMNVVVDKVMDSTEGTEAEKMEVLAEAKVWRAYYYWYLQSLYAKDYSEADAATDLSVPLSLHADLEARLPRATVADVTAQIWSDLKDAEKYMPDEPINNYRPTKASVYALKARIYFYQHQYDDAAEQARLALQVNSSLNDMRNWSFKNENRPSSGINGRPVNYYESPEKIWYQGNGFASMITSFCISDALKALYEPGDLRFKFLFTNRTRNGELWEDGLYRYLQSLDYSFTVPEMMLIEAEAMARKNDSKALDILNDLRKCRFADEDYKELTVDNTKSLLDIVLEERRRELCISGLRWLDMKRLAAENIYTTTVTRTLGDDTYTLAPNSKLYVFPIPLQVLELNANVVPNDRK